MSFVGFFFVALISFGGYAVLSVRHFYTATSHQCVLSSHSQISSLSADCKKRLRAFFVAHASSQLSPDCFSTELKKQFPVLKKITFSYKSQKKTLVTAQAAYPLFVFNNQVVLTDQKTQTSPLDFDISIVKKIPHFSVVQFEDNQLISEECIEYIWGLDPMVHALYDIEWIDKTLIKFHDKKHPQITVLGCADTKAETVADSACRELTKVLLERKSHRKIGKRTVALDNCGALAKVNSCEGWFIDRRFKGQMIVFPGGRVTNEKVVCG